MRCCFLLSFAWKVNTPVEENERLSLLWAKQWDVPQHSTSGSHWSRDRSINNQWVLRRIRLSLDASEDDHVNLFILTSLFRWHTPCSRHSSYYSILLFIRSLHPNAKHTYSSTSKGAVSQSSPGLMMALHSVNVTRNVFFLFSEQILAYLPLLNELQEKKVGSLVPPSKWADLRRDERDAKFQMSSWVFLCTSTLLPALS